MKQDKMTYLLCLDECSEMLCYDSIGEAKIEAELLAKEHGEPMKATIFDTRQAIPEDKNEFEGVEDVDVNEPLWWKKCVVPNNVVAEFTTELQGMP